MPSKSNIQYRDQAIRVLSVCAAIAACACSSDATGGGTPTAGAPNGGAPPASGGAATAGGGTAGSLAGAPSSTGGSGASGGATAGSGGAAAGAGGAATAGGGGLGGTSGGTGTAGTAGMAGMAGGGMTACVGAGHVLSLSGNGTGSASDSAKQNVDINMGSDLPIGNSARTVEAWAYMRTDDWTGNKNTLFFYGKQTPRPCPGFGLDFGAQVPSIDPFTNGGFDNDNQATMLTAATSQWVHFAMVYDPTAAPAVLLTYVNGDLKSTKVSDDASVKILKTLDSHVTVGGYPDETAYFASYIDEFRVWKIARSAADIKATMNKTLAGTEMGLVGYWQFNEASGTTAADSVTSAGHTAHPGTLMGTPVPTFAMPATPTPVTCP